jgi:hypothetical protein
MIVRALGLALVMASPAMAVNFTVSLESEQPGTQTSTSGFFVVGVEDFNGRATGAGQDFISDFGGSSVFTGTYTGVGVSNANQFGGADGAGQFANAPSRATYTLDLASTEPQGVTYFGFWLSALDGNNNLTFFQGGQELFTFNAADARSFINGLPNSGDYFGNPNAPFAGQNSREPYSFLNFYARGNTRFDQVVFSQGTSGGYESDNHTVGRWSRISGTVVSGSDVVPEPASWAMLIAGFGLVGAAMRRRQTVLA